MNATLHSLHTGLPQDYPADPSQPGPLGRPWRSAFIKTPVENQVELTATGLVGDGPADLKNHGGPDKAVNVYTLDHYPHWRSEFPDHTFEPGAFGENLTLTGVDESAVSIGDTFAVSGSTASLTVTQPRQPCWKLARRHGIKDLPQRFIETGFTGWYFAVAEPGQLSAGQTLTRISNPHPEFTLRAANDAFYNTGQHCELATALAGCHALSQSWRTAFVQKLTGR